MTAQLIVRLKTPDPAAMSALGAVSGRVRGLGGRSRAALIGLDRADVLEIALPDDSTLPALRRVLETSSVLANPNKEIAELETDPQGTPIDRPGVLVWEYGLVERPALAARVVRTAPELEGVRIWRGVLWLPRWRDGQDPLAATTELAGLDGDQARATLLVNPHGSSAVVISERIPPGLFAEA